MFTEFDGTVGATLWMLYCSQSGLVICRVIRFLGLRDFPAKRSVISGHLDIYTRRLYSRRRGVRRLVASVCLSVCPRSKRKMAWAINTKVSRHVVHRRTSACTDPEVKRSKVKGLRTYICLSWVCMSTRNRFSPHSFEMSSHTSLSDHCKHIKFAESMSIEILASKLLVVMGTYSSKLHSFLCPHFWAKRLMLVTFRYTDFR